jgi:hypothetical protein
MIRREEEWRGKSVGGAGQARLGSEFKIGPGIEQIEVTERRQWIHASEGQ